MLTRPSQLSVDTAGISRGIFAPVIREHAGTFYMITTIADRGNFIVTATNPAGPWSDPVWLPEINGKDGYDPSLFFDDDGKAYVVNNGPPIGKPLYDGHRAIWFQEFDVATNKMVGPRAVIVNGGVDLAKKPIWIEAPHIFKRDGKYYLICAEGGTADQHSEVVFRSDSPRGPYVPGPGQSDSHAASPRSESRRSRSRRPDTPTLCETQNGEWWAVFLGTRPYGDNLYNTGRETFLLPVRWVNGWPMILAGNATVPYVARSSASARATGAGDSDGRQLHGARRLHGDDARAVLDVHPHAARDVLRSDVAIRARSRSRRGRPSSALARSCRSSDAGSSTSTRRASTAMRFTPTKPGDVAGLVAFQTDDFYYLLGVTLVNGKRVVQLVERDGRVAERQRRSCWRRRRSTRPRTRRSTSRSPRAAAKYDFSYATTSRTRGSRSRPAPTAPS